MEVKKSVINKNSREILLKKLIKNKGVKLEEFFKISTQLIDILDEFHKKKIINFDINPNNILIGSNGKIRLINFKKSILMKEEKKKEFNQLEDIFKYTSPEQTGRINKSVDYRADYYSLGVTFYQLLTGKLPFDNSDKLELIYAHIAKEPVPPAEINKDIPKVLSDIIIKMMAKMPENRYQSLIGLKMDIEKCEKCFKCNGKIDEFKIAENDISNKFEIPLKLYGREEECKELLNILEKVINGSKELVLVKGNSGVGKSAFVNEIHNEIIGSSAYFISGKFEQFERERPYSAMIQIIENFINHLLVESSDELSIWREKILKAVGNNGQVIIDVIPSLKKIIGHQNPVIKLGPVETENRFKFVFENFVKVIANKEHPVVMFIDDLQWSDTASLNFIKMMMTSKTIKYLLIIGAYRDENINLIQPVIFMKNEIFKEKTNINTIKLKPLEKNVVELLVKDTLMESKTELFEIKDLIEYIYNKTEGNPLFVKQFLYSLYQKEYIWFNYDLMKWCWDITQIKTLDATENVIEMLIKRIKTLNSSTREQLITAACIGNQFALKTLALIDNTPLDSVIEDLKVAVDEGLITVVKDRKLGLSQENIKFRFLHDRIQQAVYSLINDEMKQTTHLNIGKLLLEKYSVLEKNENLFEIVRHLNMGKSIITDRGEYIKLAQLNLKAGIEAKESYAYKAAFIYFKTGVEILCENDWEENYKLTLELYTQLTEMSYLISDYEKMDKYAEIVLNNARTLIDKVKVYNVKIEAYQAQLKLQEALKIGITVLESMGINLPLKPKQTDIEQGFANVEKAMQGMEIEDLLKLPPMTDSVKLAAMEIMLSTLPTTYKAAPMLTPILTCKMVESSVKYGNSPLSAVAYAFYGNMLCASITDIEKGYKIARISNELVENQNLKQFKAKVLSLNNCCIKHWKEHLRSSLNSLTEGFKVGMENGDFEYATYCLVVHSKHSFYSGRSLNLLEEETVNNVKILEEIKQGLPLNYEKIFAQLVLNMQGKSENPVKLIGEMCDENKIFSIIHDIGDIFGMFLLYLIKTILYYQFGKYSLAVEYSKKVEENLSGAAGTVDIPIFYWYDSLSRLALYGDASDNEKEEILTKVSKNQDKLKLWSNHAPMNFLNKFYLVEAEKARVLDKTYEAIEYYDKAISMAKKYEYINDESLANELAGQFWIGENKENYAKSHLEEAYLGYMRWGAEGKVKYLENKYIEIFNKKIQENKDDQYTETNMLELVDINTIMKASQAISQEIILDELIKKLIMIIIENVGAQKAIFIMKDGNNFIIKGKKEIEEEKITVVKNMNLLEYDNIPKSVINYVSRTNESVILENSIDSLNFESDKYILENKPKSILCFPLINKKELKGIIYLENNLMTGTFTEDRLKVLEILSAQIVISLENANLYKNLESSNEILDNKVKERTSQLKEERDKLKKYLDIAEVVFLVLDKEGKVVLSNKKCCEILECFEEELLGKKIIDNFVKEEYKENLKNNFKKTIDGELAEYLEVVAITKSGQERMLDVHNAILRDKNGNLEGILTCAVDITEDNILREQLEYNKLKLEFFANLSHELKTPLNLSFCALQMLNLYRNNNVSLGINKKLDKYANIIKQNNYRLLRLVNNIVDITKINSNSFDLIMENHDIVDIIRNVTFSVSDYVQNKNRKLKFNSDIKSRIIECDSFSIERIMLNLLSNAIKFTDEQDEISVNIYDKKGTTIIVVKDTGIGIPKEKQKIIFERFRQVDKSFTRNNEGSGIGLTIVKLLVELHNGEIEVESEMGEFTKMIIKLPHKEIEEQNSCLNSYDANVDNLIDRIDIEFSDVYGL